MPIMDTIIELLSSICLVLVVIYILSYTRFFKQVLLRQFNFINQAVYIIVFGGLAVYGTYSGTPLPSGLIVNVRDLSPMIAGLIGGPVVGLGAGLIGGLHRYFMGGLSAVPCALGTVITGIVAGGVYQWRKGKFISIRGAAVLAIIIGCLDSGLALLIIRPFDEAAAAVKEVGLPVTIALTVGIIMASWLIKNRIRESEEKTGCKKG